MVICMVLVLNKTSLDWKKPGPSKIVIVKCINKVFFIATVTVRKSRDEDLWNLQTGMFLYIIKILEIWGKNNDPWKHSKVRILKKIKNFWLKHRLE